MDQTKNKSKFDESLRTWSKYAKVYDPIKCASIDGTDNEPHDRAVERALKSKYIPNRFVKGRPECTIFVSRLNHATTKETIKEIFSKYGKLKRFRMVKDIVTGMPKGYAFVEYEEERDAEDAYRLANRMVVDGNTIFVDFECERLLKDWRPRRLGGGFGGKKESGQLRFGGKDRPFKKPIALEIKEEEEKRQREKHKRNEDKYRERQRKRPYLKENSHSPKREKSNQGFPPKKNIKRSSPIKENIKRSSPIYERVKERKSYHEQEKVRYNSPLQDSGYHSSIKKRSTRHSPTNVDFKRKHISPQREQFKQYKESKYSPPREPIKVNSSPHKIFNEYYDLPRREKITRRNSPSFENVRRPYMSVDDFQQFSPVRETKRPSPSREQPFSVQPEEGQYYSSLSEENFSSTYTHIKLNSPSNDNYSSRQTVKDNYYSHKSIRNFSPSREHFLYYSSREHIRHTTPPRENNRHFSSPRSDGYFLSPKENTRYVSPSNIKKHYSPSRENRRFSPPRERDILSPRRRLSPNRKSYRRLPPQMDRLRHYSPQRDVRRY